MNQRQRDIAIRTILGEAANESPLGQAAVASVLMNRARDPRWPSTIADVALQPKQFSAWNTGAGGNDLVSKYGPGSDPYEQAGAIYDDVISGKIQDPTGGATHYYSPAGMAALVDSGAQSNAVPAWLALENARRGLDPTQIGGHIFTGRAGGPDLSYGLQPMDPQTVGATSPFRFGPDVGAETKPEGPDYAGLGLALEQAMAPQPALRPVATAPPPIPINPIRRDLPGQYAAFFGGLRT